MNFLTNIVFLNPWILAGLAGLPVLWYLLRVTPPAPKLIKLPTTRFLAGLIPEQVTASHTPWWILLIRLLIAACVLVALAGPVYKPAAELPGREPIRLVIDNSWAAAQTWDEQIKAALENLSEAARGKREVYILGTAPAPGEEFPLSQGPLSASQAQSIVKGLKPLPWPADYKAAAETIKKNPPKESVYSLWYSHGLDEGGAESFFKTLQSQGGLAYYAPRGERLPVLLRTPEKTDAAELRMAVTTPAASPPGRNANIQALSSDGRIIDQQSVTLIPGKPVDAVFDAPETLRGDIAEFRVTNAAGAGGIYLLDERYRKKTIGIVGPSENTDPKPFVEARYYISRALEPYATLIEGQPEELLKRDPAMIILPDVASLPPASLNNLEKWVKGGGLLLRFAGPNMAAAQDKNFLIPTPLRTGGRSLDGSLTWEKPQKLKPFPENSPLYGVAARGDITIKRQLLAEPVPDLDKKTWASLEDGTPLITAAPLDKGMLVMIHTSADASWSDLPLSGLFVEILRRVSSIAGRRDFRAEITGALEPIWVMDGMGAMGKPDASAAPIPAPEFDKTTPGPKHPPGLYGRGGYELALNLGDHLKNLRTVESIPLGVAKKSYGQNYERDLMPFILYAAFLLLLADWLIMIIIAGAFSRPLLRFAGAFMIFALLPITAQAEPTPNDVKYAGGLYLAYIQTGDPVLDSMSQHGLENLSAVLQRRTSVEPDGVIGLDPESDALIFFPLIYWPVSLGQAELSDKALAAIQNYLDHGGTILFDARDGRGASDAVNPRLTELVGRLNIPALAPIQKDHVLLRSFYLLDIFPGRLASGALWVESQSSKGRDGVSSVIIGSNDWAGAWAEDTMVRSTMTGSTRQQELAFRFGVNAVMYALTGNYKEDQIHVKSILERLGQ